MSEVLAMEAPVKTGNGPLTPLASTQVDPLPEGEGRRPLPFKIIVIGPQGSGKSAFAKMLGERLGVKVGETSEALIQEASALMSSIDWIRYVSPGLDDGHVNWEMHYRRKSVVARRELIIIGDLMTRLKPACLMDVAGVGCEIIVGARRKIELEAWFSAGRWTDILIEIEGGDDPHYELKGWYPGHHNFVNFRVPPKDETWAAKADAVAEDILEMAAEFYAQS